MRKKVYGRKLAREIGSRRALFRGLIRVLVLHGAIETTSARAKAIQGDIDKLITTAKAGTIFSKRRVLAKLGNDTATTEALFNKYLPAMGGRQSGYTRISHLQRRSGDQADMVKLEFVDKPVKVEEVKTEKKSGDKSQVKSKK